jgi:hypothetical protein
MKTTKKPPSAPAAFDSVRVSCVKRGEKFR